MLIIRKNQTNNLIATVSMNKTLPNPYYLFSFQHIASKERISFYPQVITSNVRYDKFRFVEAPTTNLSTTPPQVFFEYLGQYYYSIYENITSGSTDINLAYNKLESGRAWVIVGNDDMDECFFEPYISNDEDFAQIIYVSEEEEACIYPTPSITPSNTPTPSITPSTTPVPTNTPTSSATPTITPTNTLTPTPSQTSPTSFNPATLNALWWIDFTDISTLNLNFGNQITQALDKIANVPFTAQTPGAPIWTNLYELSGSSWNSANQLRNASGAYSTFSEYTWFGRVYDDVVSQRGGKFIAATDNGIAWPAGTAFALILDGNFNPYPPGPVWRFQNRTNGGTSVILDTNFTYSAWTNIALRSYNSGGDCVLEVWENGSIITSGLVSSQSALTVNNPIFSLVFDGGLDYNTEQSFFDRKLNNTEMAQMFSYFTNKY